MSSETDKFPTTKLLNKLNSLHDSFVKDLTRLLEECHGSYIRDVIGNLVLDLKEDKKLLIKEHTDEKLKFEAEKRMAKLKARTQAEPAFFHIGGIHVISPPSPKTSVVSSHDNFWPDKDVKRWMKLYRLEQTGSVREFAEKFKEIYDTLEVKPEKGGLHIFFDNLKESIKKRFHQKNINLEKLKNFKELLNMALQYEISNANSWKNYQASCKAYLSIPNPSRADLIHMRNIFYVPGYGYIDQNNTNEEDERWLRLFRLKQTDSVASYVAKFEELYETLEEKPQKGLSDLMELFYDGLKRSSKNRMGNVNFARLKNFDALVSLALKTEEDLKQVNHRQIHRVVSVYQGPYN